MTARVGLDLGRSSGLTADSEWMRTGGRGWNTARRDGDAEAEAEAEVERKEAWAVELRACNLDELWEERERGDRDGWGLTLECYLQDFRAIIPLCNINEVPAGFILTDLSMAFFFLPMGALVVCLTLEQGYRVWGSGDATAAGDGCVAAEGALGVRGAILLHQHVLYS
ncbi:hypothetical protein B0H14DRAFT_2613668 [Mycena olivaceomarginata]|nr:hypothetical protein B0H14DRAFT_2613668 [Mycena olivaceomarginata]